MWATEAGIRLLQGIPRPEKTGGRVLALVHSEEEAPVRRFDASPTLAHYRRLAASAITGAPVCLDTHPAASSRDPNREYSRTVREVFRAEAAYIETDIALSALGLAAQLLQSEHGAKLEQYRRLGEEFGLDLDIHSLERFYSREAGAGVLITRCWKNSLVAGMTPTNVGCEAIEQASMWEQYNFDKPLLHGQPPRLG